MSNKQNVTNNIKVPNNNLEVLKKHFPECFDKEGNFQFEKFKNNLSENDINFSKESYSLDWLGKKYARLLATDEATTLLKADEAHNSKAENKNAQNLLLKGDNLEVLKHLSGAYYEKVKMIYIDPPYNTGGDGFVYADDRKFTVEQLQELAGVSEEKAKQILAFTQSNSNSHSAWLTFMYPRLHIAKKLLKDDGVIFISIDDNEVAQLRLLMDEIFGEDDFISDFVWVNNQRGRSTDKFISNTYENILLYGKNIDLTSINQELEIDDNKLSKYNFEDEKSYYKKGDNLFNNNSQFNVETRPNLVYSIYVNKVTNEWICVDEKQKDDDGNWYLPFENKKGDDFIKVTPPIRKTNNKLGCWRWSISKFENEGKSELLLEQKKDGSFMFYTKDRLDEFGQKWKKFKNLIIGITSSGGTTEVVNIFNDKIFSSPKPSRLIKVLVSMSLKKDDLILDFFAGSGTTADAVMQLNAEDGGNRRFVMVQLPEPIDPKKNKASYDFVTKELKAEPTIFEITKERIKRAAKKIQAENKEKIDTLKGELPSEENKTAIQNLENQDLGFKIFETMPIWEDYGLEAKELTDQTVLFDETQLSNEDLKALLTTWKTNDGIALTTDLENIDLGNYTAYYGEGNLYLMYKAFSTDNLKSILEKIDADKQFNPTSITAFGYNFESKHLRELAENVKSYANKKNIDIDFITKY